MLTGSTVIPEPTINYYWILYMTSSGRTIGICTTVHPFKYINDVNVNEPNQKFGRINLLDWKEITKDEFLLWVELNPHLAESPRNK